MTIKPPSKKPWMNLNTSRWKRIRKCMERLLFLRNEHRQSSMVYRLVFFRQNVPVAFRERMVVPLLFLETTPTPGTPDLRTPTLGGGAASRLLSLALCFPPSCLLLFAFRFSFVFLRGESFLPLFVLYQ